MLYFMIIIGAVAGFLCMEISKKLISKRTGSSNVQWYLTQKYAFLLWCVMGAAGFGIIQSSNLDYITKIECVIVLLLCIMLSSVDFAIRKIPNSLLLLLIICRVIFLALNFSIDAFISSLAGFGVAIVIFIIPSLLKLHVGAGDIKLAAVTGFYLGINGFLQAMIIMAVTISIYGIYIIVKRIGSFKTKTAMGPYLAFGLICTMIFPLI